MCIIVAKQPGVIVDLETMKNCWDANPHGAGFCTALDGTVSIIKGLMSWEEFKEIYGDPEFWRELPLIVHFRIATHGAVDEDNTHPFEVIPGKLAFAHNGVLSGMQVKHRPELSDTQVFNRYVLKQLPHNFLRNDAIRTLLDQACGGYNKLAFLEGDGTITIVNEKAGTTRADGVWFSNHDYTGWVYNTHTKRWGSPLRPGWGLVDDDPLYGSHGDSRDTKGSDSAKTRWGLDDEYAVVEFEDKVTDFYCCSCSHWFEDDSVQGSEIPQCPLCGRWDEVFDADDMMDFPKENETTDPWEEADHADNPIL